MIHKLNVKVEISLFYEPNNNYRSLNNESNANFTNY